MAQLLQTSFITAVAPGAFPSISVQNTTGGAAASGIVAIIGEADAGSSYIEDQTKDNFFGPDQFDAIVRKYSSGHIVDAFRALSAPSNDVNIGGSVTRIYVVKTNDGTKASAIVDTDYAEFTAKNYGIIGNQTRYRVSSLAGETAPSVTSIAIPAFGAALNQADFGIRMNGGASATVTLSNTSGDHADRATLLVELASLLPAGITASAGVAADTIVLTMDADVGAYRRGFGKSLELIETTPADLAKFGLVAGLYSSSVEPAVSTQIVNVTNSINENWQATSDVALRIGYQGTTATVTITSTALTTSVTGGSGANLSLTLADYQTIGDLATFINLQTGYTATVASFANQLPPTALDKVSAVGICSTGASLTAGRIKAAYFLYQRSVSQSLAIDFVADDADGLPNPMASFEFLAGGTKGVTTGADYVAALDTLEGVAVNFVVPLFSQDASLDIIDNQTESGSTYTIDAINAATKSHCLELSTPRLKRNRLAVLSNKGTFSESQGKAQTLASARVAMTFQDVFQINSQGQVIQFQPWLGACVAAGMQAAGFYRGITNKFANLISYTDPSGFSSGSPTDIDTMLLSGMLGLQQDTSGVKWTADQTTYTFDTNFVYNSLQAMYGADLVALDLADSFQKAFVGQSLADVSAASGLAFLSSKMETYRRIRLITGSDDAPAGFRNAKVRIEGPTMFVSVEVLLSTSLYFIPIEISISQVSQSAGA